MDELIEFALCSRLVSTPGVLLVLPVLIMTWLACTF